MKALIELIESAWENKELLKDEKTQNSIREVVRLLDIGEIRVAEPSNNEWIVNEWIKKAVVMYFPIQKMQTIEVPPLEPGTGLKTSTLTFKGIEHI